MFLCPGLFLEAWSYNNTQYYKVQKKVTELSCLGGHEEGK